MIQSKHPKPPQHATETLERMEPALDLSTENGWKECVLESEASLFTTAER